MAPISSKQIDKLARQAKKSRVNRCYDTRCFKVVDIYEAGIVQLESIGEFDRVVVDEESNESIAYLAFDREGSYVQLTLSIWSLYPSHGKHITSQYRLASVKFAYYNAREKAKYHYQVEELIDYEEKRSQKSTFETRHVYSVGSLRIEVKSPFALSRILFNGLINRTKDNASKVEQISTRISISTHPTCDKFDYRYRFSGKFLAKIIQNSKPADIDEANKMRDLVLENRIDQSMMFQGQIDHLNSNNQATTTEHFILWGSKVKRLVDPISEMNSGSDNSSETLVVWSEAGTLIQMNRSLKHPNLIFGMVQNTFDYPGHFYDVKLLHKERESTKEVSFDQLSSFMSLNDDYLIQVTSFRSKVYTIKLNSFKVDASQPIKSTTILTTSAEINDFSGFACAFETHIGKDLAFAQSKLWSIPLDDHQMGHRLACEQLLGGKGNSLVELQKMNCKTLVVEGAEVSVPKGLVVSCIAYELWLESSPLIKNSIQELDATRRSLAARSFYTNPMSDDYLSMAQAQQILRDQCKKTSLVLNSCPLPPVLRKHLFSELLKLFSEDELRDNPLLDDSDNLTASPIDRPNRKLFAVRSSAVGEDSIETSAAGQMKSILDACGFNSICNAIVECWASQFELEAITYKSQNGIQINMPMAVVVQELIECKMAGVAATCDPLTGNKNELQILANLGMGEGVVSGKQTDTIRVELSSLLEWNSQLDSYIGHLKVKQTKDHIRTQSDSTKCCLDDHQVVALSNLLLSLRRASVVKDREIEWGITVADDSSSSSSSSSSGSSRNGGSSMHIHLLQSRPLTHLHRLNTYEIDHELDYGLSSPLDLVSRANLGEVMPGAFCPTNSTYFHPLVASYGTLKPYEKCHTKKAFASDVFCYYGGMAMMVLTYTDSINRFMSLQGPDGAMKRAMVDSMIGTALESEAREADPKHGKFLEEKTNPVAPMRNISLGLILALDSKAAQAYTALMRRKAESVKFTEDLHGIDELIERMEKSKLKRNLSNEGDQSIEDNIAADSRKLFDRLCRQTSALSHSWTSHIKGTLLSMAFNTMCMKLLSEQPAYPEAINSHEVLTDFSVLIRGNVADESEESTESCDISKLLGRLMENLAEEGELDKLRKMDHKQLYTFLTSSSCSGAKLFRKFMDKNGHRAFKEFDFSTLSWSDDPSYIIRSLAMRLKHANQLDLAKAHEFAETRAREHEEKVREIVAKIEKGKFFLLKYGIPRAKHAVVRREQSKSFLIKTVAKFRRAFRHLGALLCLLGVLPSADLVFWLTIEELDSLTNVSNSISGSNVSTLLYKARRRQQRARAYDSIKFPRPTMKFMDAVELLRGVDNPTQQQQHESAATSGSGETQTSAAVQVSGMTSCAGYVNGRACVVNSIEDMDQIEPNDILITYSIDISWSVYFFTIAGIVTEVGGIVSHGAVVAREYGIPTLCTAVGACSKFKTGQMVTLDASRGVCYLAEDNNETNEREEHQPNGTD